MLGPQNGARYWHSASAAVTRFVEDLTEAGLGLGKMGASSMLRIEHTRRIGPDDPWFQMLSGEWLQALTTGFGNIEDCDI